MVFYLMNFFFTIIELNNKILIFDVDLVFFLNNDIKENNSLNYIFQDYMELFVDPHQNYTFLLEIIIKYLKLDERKKVKVINLSPVTSNLCSSPSKPSIRANSASLSPPSSPPRATSKHKYSKYAKSFFKSYPNSEPFCSEKENKQTKSRQLKAS